MIALRGTPPRPWGGVRVASHTIVSMPRITLSRSVAAPIERCFDLSRSVEFHLASTPRTDEEVVGGVRAGLLGLGDCITWRARHLGVRQILSSQITVFERPIWFRDTMTRGAFRRFDHDHRFAPDPERPARTIVTENFDYTSPLGPLGRLANALFLTAYMRRFLTRRLDALVAVLESDAWRRFLP